MSTARYLIGDTRAVVATLPDNSVDLVLTSPPFLALRSYLPNDDPNKALEIGQEANPAAFLDVLLELTAGWRRVLAPHGSICVELGDTYAGNIPPFGATADKYSRDARGTAPLPRKGDGWPLAKSLALVPELYRIALAYGINPLTGAPSPAGRWRVRNVVRWHRPNPPVGALGDKYRPSTSDMVIACVSDRRWFDLDAVREPGNSFERDGERKGRIAAARDVPDQSGSAWMDDRPLTHNPAGAPPLDTWVIPTEAYPGSHYATFPRALCVKPIKSMCPEFVCPDCGPIPPVQSINDDTIVRDVPGSDHEQAGDAVLFAGVRVDQDAQSAARPDLVARATQELAVRLRGVADAGSPDGIEVGGAVRASAGDGRAPWADVAADGGGAPHQRCEERQPNRKPRTAREAGARPQAQAEEACRPLPPLRGDARDNRACPTCGGPTRRGVVLDPFGGSGTTGAVATGLGRDAVLIDLDARNAELARERIGMFLDVTEGVQQ